MFQTPILQFIDMIKIKLTLKKDIEIYKGLRFLNSDGIEHSITYVAEDLVYVRRLGSSNLLPIPKSDAMRCIRHKVWKIINE